MEVLNNFAAFVQDQNRSYLSGSVDANTSLTTLYVNDHKQVIFPFPSNEELKALYEKSQPASFGRGQEAVLDPTYRSARTLVTENFAINLRPDPALLHQIKQLMINGKEPEDYVRAELYRVNLYGPGDFFKEHKDTPQSGSGHFGSLVYCLPSVFEGGALVVQNPKGEEVKFDWAAKYAAAATASADAATSTATAPSHNPPVEFAAFASDLTHRVEPVTAGYRVTVTFHLFRETIVGFAKLVNNDENYDEEEEGENAEDVDMEEEDDDGDDECEEDQDEDEWDGMENTAEDTAVTEEKENVHHEQLEKSLVLLQLENAKEVQALMKLKASNQLKGKHVLFPLMHHYAARKGAAVVLKGGDAALFQMLKEKAQVSPKIMFYYDYEEEDDEDEDEDDDDEMTCYLTSSVIMYTQNCYYEDVEDSKLIHDFADKYKVFWARRALRSSVALSFGATYGNEPSIECYKGNLCILTTW